MSEALGTGAATMYLRRLHANRANGAIVKMEPDDFFEIVRRSVQREESPLVVYTEGGWFSSSFAYIIA